MKTYARIYNGLIAELFTTNGDINSMFATDLTWADISLVIPEPQVGWAATMQDDQVWAFEAPMPTTTAQLLAKRQETRRTEILQQLDKIDFKSIRPTRILTEAATSALPVPEEEIQFLKSLEQEATLLREELRALEL